MNFLTLRGTPYSRPAQGNPFVRARELFGTIRAEECRQYFSAFGQFTYQEVLGVGGFGVVVKYAQTDAQGRHLRYFVVKVPRRTDSKDGGENAANFQKEFICNVPRDAYFSPVIRACIGIAWPRLTADEATEMAIIPGQLRPIPETIKEIRPIAPVSIVHFDIDPSNVLLGDFHDDAPEHAIQPVFKVLIEGTSTGHGVGETGPFHPGFNTYGPHTNVYGVGTASSHPLFSSQDCILQGQNASTYGWLLVQNDAGPPAGAEALYRKYPGRSENSWPAHYIAEGDALEAQGRSPQGENNADIERFCLDYIVGTPSLTSASTRQTTDDEEAGEARDGLGGLGLAGQGNMGIDNNPDMAFWNAGQEEEINLDYLN
ncbi:hypothetical protein PG994_007832 [Apiospora phragmitis]|uniref:Protein kinase domain-containing protein n=1 Tax=Apiospora phragmitis TaxID=2905665 RepID=A0ABR1URB4_9PEZI